MPPPTRAWRRKSKPNSAAMPTAIADSNASIYRDKHTSPHPITPIPPPTESSSISTMPSKKAQNPLSSRRRRRNSAPTTKTSPRCANRALNKKHYEEAYTRRRPPSASPRKPTNSAIRLASNLSPKKNPSASSFHLSKSWLAPPCASSASLPSSSIVRQNPKSKNAPSTAFRRRISAPESRARPSTPIKRPPPRRLSSIPSGSNPTTNS